MREHDLARVAARNNAEWCDTFCRTHAVAGRFDDNAWWSAERTPPLYPDAVTLLPSVDGRSILSRIDAGPGCSIKDSFGDLDLRDEGFDVLFRAEWLCLERVRGAAPRWSAITSAEELATWEAAWGEAPEAPPFFRRALLVDETVTILGRYEGEGIEAGAIANRSTTAIGLSNVFAADGDLKSAYVGAASAAQAQWGSLPLVAYEFGDSLDAVRRAGFSTVGELAVWASR